MPKKPEQISTGYGNWVQVHGGGLTQSDGNMMASHHCRASHIGAFPPATTASLAPLAAQELKVMVACLSLSTLLSSYCKARVSDRVLEGRAQGGIIKHAPRPFETHCCSAMLRNTL